MIGGFAQSIHLVSMDSIAGYILMGVSSVIIFFIPLLCMRKLFPNGIMIYINNNGGDDLIQKRHIVFALFGLIALFRLLSLLTPDFRIGNIYFTPIFMGIISLFIIALFLPKNSRRN